MRRTTTERQAARGVEFLEWLVYKSGYTPEKIAEGFRDICGAITEGAVEADRRRIRDALCRLRCDEGETLNDDLLRRGDVLKALRPPRRGKR